MLLIIPTEVEVAKHTVSTGQLIPHTEHKTKPEQHPSSKCPQNRWRPDRWCGGGLVWGGSQGHGRLDRLVFAAASITNRLRVAPCLRLLTPHNLSMLAPLSPHTSPHTITTHLTHRQRSFTPQRRKLLFVLLGGNQVEAGIGKYWTWLTNS